VTDDERRTTNDQRDGKPAAEGGAQIVQPGSQPTSARLTLVAGLVIALCILGDSFLYSILPLEAANLGIALPLVGVLLSANRLVRLLSNTAAGRVYERFGTRRPFAFSAAFGVLTTAIYALGQGFWLFLPARLGWGIAWSGLRQGGYQAVWASDERLRGRLMGLLWGVIRLGSALSVVAGGYLWDQYGYRTAALAVLAASVFAAPLAVTMRWPGAMHHASPGKPRDALWSGLVAALQADRSRRLLLAGFIYAVFEGVLISTTSLFLAGRLGADGLPGGLGLRVGTVAGFLLAVRWTSEILFGPAIGALADRFGRVNVLLGLAFSLLAGVIGMTWLAGLPLLLSLLVAFVSSAGLNITFSAVASIEAQHTARPQLFVGAYATAGDAGSASGPLLAYSLSALAGGMQNLYLVGAAILAAAVATYWRYINQRTP
jgi:MFS family permease